MREKIFAFTSVSSEDETIPLLLALRTTQSRLLT